MADLIKLPIEAAPLSPTFRGTPQQLFEAMVERMRVLFPTSQTSFEISDTEPGTNLGPWLKGGTQWYVWSEAEKRYVPFDASPSWEVAISATAPATGDMPIWVKFTPATDSTPARALGIYLFLGGVWVPIGSPAASGATASRPTAPLELERYFDTEIGVEIYWRGGQWRTVYGSLGDIKFVTHQTLADALKFNPGWTEIGQFYSDSNVRGRAIVAAHKDTGLTPSANFPPASGITSRAVADRYGAENVTQTIAQMPPHHHGSWTNALTYHGPGSITGTAGDNFDVAPKNTQDTGGGDPMTILPPSMACWCLVKL